MAKDLKLQEARALGAARLIGWTKDGSLIPLEEVAGAWGLRLPNIEAAVRRGDLFVVWVDQLAYVPVELIALGADKSFAICPSLMGQSASSKLVFLKRPHGSLGGKTVIEALRSGTPLSVICSLAESSALP